LSKTTTMPDKIPLIDLAAQYAQIGPEIEAAMAEVIAANAFIGGPYLKNFQDEFTAYCGGTDYRGEELHTVGVSSGTAAWHLLLLAHGIGPGDEVIIPSHTFFATAEGIALTGAMPVFGEIDLDTYTLHPIAAEAMITPRTKAICAVHLYGRLADITGLRELADAHNLLLFEDAAQAHGAIHVSNQSDTTEPPIEAPQTFLARGDSPTARSSASTRARTSARSAMPEPPSRPIPTSPLASVRWPTTVAPPNTSTTPSASTTGWTRCRPPSSA
jgi:hypothetical protein